MNENPLNILHTIGFDQLYPMIRCQLKFETPTILTTHQGRQLDC